MGTGSFLKVIFCAVERADKVGIEIVAAALLLGGNLEK
jgi:hypothetical protein